MTKAIYFDMDGTIANLYGVDGWLDCIIKEYTKPYREAKSLINMRKLSKELNDKICLTKNICRGILKKTSANANGIYNQDLDKKVILLEIGGYQNSIEEVTNTLELIANSLKDYFNV